jgi:hypothetical protein
MSRERLRELIKKHKESRNERVGKRTTDQLSNSINPIETPISNSIMATPKPDSSFKLALRHELFNVNPTPHLTKNPFTPLVMPDKLNEAVNSNNTEESSESSTDSQITNLEEESQVDSQTPNIQTQAVPQLIPATPSINQLVTQTSTIPTPSVPQTPVRQLVSQTPNIQTVSVPQTPARQLVPQTPVPQTPARQLVPQTPVPQTPARQLVPQTPVPQTPARQLVPQTPVPQTPARELVPQTPVPQTPVRQSVPQTPVRQSVPQTPSVPSTPSRQSVAQTPNIQSQSIPQIPAHQINSYKPMDTESKVREEDIENLDNKSLWVKLIKRSQCTALSSDVIDGCKDLIREVIREMCEFVIESGQYELTSEIINKYIAIHFKNLQINTQMNSNSDLVFPQSNFYKFIISILHESKVSIKPEYLFVLQMYIEFIIVKMLNGAELVKEGSKRKRVFATDLLISYQIYRM